MSEIILAHPYSGALYGYFSDQIGGDSSHTLNAKHPGYYKSIYGKLAASTVELALNFLLLYDEVWVAPADTHWPESKINPGDRKHVAELGLNSDWEDFHRSNYTEVRQYIHSLLAEPQLKGQLKKLKIPEPSWKIVIEYALYEAGLSARTRVPILCSPGRRALIMTLVEIQRPALHPVFASSKQLQFIQAYRSLTSLALTPRSLDELMTAKPDPSVRKYATSLISVAEDAGLMPDKFEAAKVELAKAALEAINTERVSQLYAGALKWGASFLRLVHEPILSGVATGVSYLATRGADAAGWYEFTGSIDRAISRADMIRDLEIAAKGQASDA